MANAMQAGWAIEQRKGPQGWEQFSVCSADRGKKHLTLRKR
jgi:hypothetical protein